MDDIRIRYAVLSIDRLAEIIPLAMLVWDSQADRLYVGDGATAGGVPCISDAGTVPQYKAVAASVVTTETVYWRPQTSGSTLRVTLAAGVGAFTKPIVISRETRADGASSGAAVAEGTRFTLSLVCTTIAAGRVVQIRDNAVGGDLLDTFTSDIEGTFTASAEYVYSGAQWLKISSAIQAA